MTYVSPPGADDPWQPGDENTVRQPDPYPPPYAAPYQPGYPYQPVAYPYGYADPYGYPGYPAARPTDGIAIASLVVSCVSVLGLCGYGIGGLLGIVGAILGHVARGRIRRTGADGDGMALAGIIVGWVATALGILIVAFFVVFLFLIGTAPDTATT